MKYREIPRTDLTASVIGLGTMTWGEQNTEAEGHEQMDYALSQGVSFWDTAELYPVPPMAETYTETERIIGTWFKSRGKRDEVTLATKVAGPAEFVSHIRGGSGLDRKNIETAIEGSLKRLQTDRIDLYQLHWPARTVPIFGERDYEYPEMESPDATSIEETLQVLADLQETGKVRYFGLSNETPWGTMKFLQLAEQHGYPRIATIQNSYSLINRTFDTGLKEICHREDVRLLAYSPLAFGKLSGKYLDGKMPEGARVTKWERFARYNGDVADEAIRAYVDIAKAADLDACQMALAWINEQEHCASNLIGATTMEQLKSNIASIDVTLSDDVKAAIAEVHARIPNPCP